MLVICKVRQFYRQPCIVSNNVISLAVLLDYCILLVVRKIRQFYQTTLIVNVQCYTVLLD